MMVASARLSPAKTLLIGTAGLLLMASGLLLHGSPEELQAFRIINSWGPLLPDMWAALSLLGLGLSAVLLVGALGPRQAPLLARILLMLLLGGLLVQGIKHAAAMPRPLALLGADTVHVIGDAMFARAMPSGHSALAFALIALVLPSRAALAWLPLALAIGASRIAVGAHWPADVLFGAGLGLCVGLMLTRSAAALRLGAWMAEAAAARVVSVGLAIASLAMLAWPLGTPETWLLQGLLGAAGLLGACLWWPRESRFPFFALGLLAALALAMFLFSDTQAWRTEFSEAHGRLLQLPRLLWLEAMAGFMLSYALRAWRLHAQWQPRLQVSWLECLVLTLQHNAAVNLLPMRAGEASLPWQIHRRWGVPLREAALSLLWIRLHDAAVLGLLALLLLVPGPWALRLAAALAAALIGLWLLPRAARLAEKRRWLAQPLAAARGRRLSAIGLASTLASWLVKLGVLAVLLSQLAGLPPLSAASGALGGELAALWPLQAPAGLGSYEAGVWGGARLQLSFDEAKGARLLIAALTVHVLSLACACLCALPTLFLTAGRQAATPNHASLPTSRIA